MRVFITIVVLFASVGFAFAQQFTPPAEVKNLGERITPPKSANGEKFKASADRRWQRTQGIYLSKDVDSEKNVPEEKIDNSSPNIDAETAQWIAFIILVIFIIGGAVLWWFNRTGGGLFRSEANEDRFTDAILREVVGGAEDEALSIDDLSYEKLTSMGDTKQGLRLLLLHGLKRAAGENNIPLRRSLTTRDIFSRVPDAWQNRPELATIVAHAEPVLFGGRTLDQQNYLSLLEISKPLFAKSSSRRLA